MKTFKQFKINENTNQKYLTDVKDVGGREIKLGDTIEFFWDIYLSDNNKEPKRRTSLIYLRDGAFKFKIGNEYINLEKAQIKDKKIKVLYI